MQDCALSCAALVALQGHAPGRLQHRRGDVCGGALLGVRQNSPMSYSLRWVEAMTVRNAARDEVAHSIVWHPAGCPTRRPSSAQPDLPLLRMAMLPHRQNARAFCLNSMLAGLFAIQRGVGGFCCELACTGVPAFVTAAGPSCRWSAACRTASARRAATARCRSRWPWRAPRRRGSPRARRAAPCTAARFCNVPGLSAGGLAQAAVERPCEVMQT